jgi:large subunit ribosomal protein L13
MNKKTFQIKSKDITRKWYVINASGKVLGRMATRIASILQGKRKAYFSPHMDCGDFVIVTNAAGIKLTGNKLNEKFEYRHSGYFGGDRYEPYKKLIKAKPERIIQLAVRDMLPKNKLRAKYLKHLKIYPGVKHPHGSQQPVEMNV